MEVKISHDHKCECIAQAPNMSEDRDWWVGRLTEKVEEYPDEKYCLHMKTPVKEVVFLCNRADFEQLLVLCKAITGNLNEKWIEKMLAISKNKSTMGKLEDYQKTIDYWDRKLQERIGVPKKCITVSNMTESAKQKLYHNTMSAGLRFTIQEHLMRGKDPDELLEEIKSEWLIKDDPDEIERAKKIIEEERGKW